MSSDKKLLSDFATVISGYAFKSEWFGTGNDKVIRIGDLQEGSIQTESALTVDATQYKISDNFKIQNKDILMALSGATVGKIAVASDGDVGAYINQRVAIIRAKDKITADYLKFFFSGEFLDDLLKNAGGAAQPNLSPKQLLLMEIPLPPLSEQRRIASILDKANELRQKRQQTIEKLDQLLQATFIDMFGDPVSNPKGWDLYKLSDLGSISTGNTPSRDDADNFGNYLEWIKSDNLNNDEDYATTATEYLSEKGAKKGRVVPEGSILVTCIAGSFDCIGNLAMVDRKVSFNQQINSITPNDTVVLEFLYYLMKISKPIIQNASTNSMKGMISKSKFSEILLPIPSKEKQIQFVELFKKLYGLKVSHKLYSNNADLLFKSLQNQAFNGIL